MDRLSPDTLLPWTGMTLQKARDDLTARHFAKELMDENSHERSLLYIAEGLLRLADPASYGITRIERAGENDDDRR